MKKYIFCLAFLILVVFGVEAQTRTNLNIDEGSINISTAFLDASSTVTWNNSTNVGKGLNFPRTNLVNLVSMSSGASGIPNNNPNRFDGLVVYNTVTGPAGIGTTQVEPGFYYYSNQTTNVNGGQWLPFSSGMGYEILEATTPAELTANERAVPFTLFGDEVYTVAVHYTLAANGNSFDLSDVIPNNYIDKVYEIRVLSDDGVTNYDAGGGTYDTVNNTFSYGLSGTTFISVTVAAGDYKVELKYTKQP